jgi:hypothetical protein
MTPTQQRAGFKRMTLKIQALERETVDLKSEISLFKTSEVMVATALSLAHTSDLGDILAEIKHLKEIQRAVNGK